MQKMHTQVRHDEAEVRTEAQLRRSMVDLIGEARSRAIRIALFGEMLYRPDPSGQETEDQRATHRKLLSDTVGWIERPYIMLTRFADPNGEFPDEICAWLKPFAEENSDAVEQLRLMTEASRRVSDAAEADSSDQGPALRAHYDLRRGTFLGAISALCAKMWAQMDDSHEEELAQAREAINTTHQALKRMEQIATHVRLVAINAAIEANKLGDDGRGIAFIAAEFKSLAEELQSLSASARGDVVSKPPAAA